MQSLTALRFLLWSSLILFFTNASYADVSSSSQRKTKSKKVVEERPTEYHTALGKKVVKEHEGILFDSSEANRDGKSYDLVGELLGFSVMPAISAGLTLGYYWNADMVFEFNYARGSFSLYFFDVSTQVYSARLKRYWGNSFYTNSGLAVRDLTFKFNYLDLDNSATIVKTGAGSLGLKTAVADLAIGNI